MTRLITCMAALWMSFATSLHAEQVVVVELFTSQGCSSCPPADQILSELASRDDVVALSYHVDYWDYLGWADDFAKPAFTDYQRAYARAAGKRTIYTPQMVIGGSEHVIGSKPMKIANAIRKHAARSQPVTVDLTRSGDRVIVRATAAGRISSEAVVRLITYLPQATVNIRRGENAGKTLSYDNIVRTMDPIGTWNGRTEFRASAQVPEGLPLVVMVQAGDAGPVLGVARLR